MRVAWISLALNVVTLCVLLRTLWRMQQTDQILDNIEASLDTTEDAVAELERERAAKAAGP